MTFKNISTILFIYLIYYSISLSSEERKFENYTVYHGGPITIPNGAIVEGSLGHGGTQANFLVDLENSFWKPHLEFAKSLKKSTMPMWDKANLIQERVQDILSGKTSSNSKYRKLLKEYASKGKAIPLSEFIRIGAGVCRENALISHFLLKTAGIPNEYVYALVAQGENADIIEDHAFTIIKEGKRFRHFDSYFINFHGLYLDDLLKKDGVIRTRKTSTNKEVVVDIRKIKKIHKFPKIWAPNKKVNIFCKQIFLNY